MKANLKSNAGLYWVIVVIAASMVGFVYLVISDAPRTLPKIKLSYFTDEQEIADSIVKRLSQEISANKNYWVGMEPGKTEQLDVIYKIKTTLEKTAPFQKVIVDSELALKNEELQRFGVTESISIKEEIPVVTEILTSYEKQNLRYFVITASIYSTSLLPANPIHKIREKFPELKPMTFSLGYFAANIDDEKNFLFPCDTENHAGVKDWGCYVVNKARTVRRKLEHDNPKPWIGLMDLSGEKDYVLLLKKKK